MRHGYDLPNGLDVSPEEEINYRLCPDCEHETEPVVAGKPYGLLRCPNCGLEVYADALYARWDELWRRMEEGLPRYMRGATGST